MVLKPRDPPGHSFVGMQWLGKFFLSIIIAIATGSAPVRWPEIDSGTCLLKSAVALQRSQYQVTEKLHRGNVDAVKHPNIIILIDLFISSNSFLPPVDEANGILGFLNATKADSLPLHVLLACPST
jgi:hypothetical protein